eukprot:8076933-Pyramimonas_sp.AAC.1
MCIRDRCSATAAAHEAYPDVSSAESYAIAPFPIEELRAQLANLKNGKCCDQDGVCAEMLKNAGVTVEALLLDARNNIISPVARGR